MKTKVQFQLAAMALLALLPSAVFAAAPNLLNYQGLVTTAPVDTSLQQKSKSDWPAISQNQADLKKLAPMTLRATFSGEQIKWYVFSGSGDRGTSTNYILSGTVGQTAIGPGTTTSYSVNSGFWQHFSGGSSGCCVGLTGNTDCDAGSGVDISDLTALIDHMFIGLNPLCCSASGNVDGSVDGIIDISDLTRLIDFLFINFTPPAACQ